MLPMTLLQVDRFVVSLEEGKVCVFDPITETTVTLPESSIQFIEKAPEVEVVPWLKSLFSWKRLSHPDDNVDDQPKRRRK